MERIPGELNENDIKGSDGEISGIGDNTFQDADIAVDGVDWEITKLDYGIENGPGTRGIEN